VARIDVPAERQAGDGANKGGEGQRPAIGEDAVVQRRK